MGTYIIKLDKYYMEWSTVVDSPITFGMELNEFKDYYFAKYGWYGGRDLEERLSRVESKGTSSLIHNSVEEVLAMNRAGPDETELTAREILKAYCLQESIRDGWTAPIAANEDGEWQGEED